MSSLNIREFATVGLDERLPEASKVVANAIPVQSVITGRRTQKYTPVNGSSFTESQNPTFKLSANSDFLIPSSATLHFRLRNTSDNAGTTACFDDPTGLVPFSRGLLRASGVLIEDILDVARSSAAMTYTHMSPERYAKQGSIDTANWKWNRDFYTSDITIDDPVADISAVDPDNPTEAEIELALDTVTQPTATLVRGLRLDGQGVSQRQLYASDRDDDEDVNEVEINLPLSYIFGLFRTNRLFPLSFIGQLEIEFTLAQAVRAIVDSTIPPGAVGYTVKDMYITADLAQVSDDYLKILAQSFASPDPAMAYNLPVDTLTNTAQNKQVPARPGAVGTFGNSLNSYVYSKSTPFLKAIMFTSQNNRVSASTYATSGMPCFFSDPRTTGTGSSVRLNIGSEVFPSYGVLDSPEEIMRHNMIGLGAQGNVASQMGLVSRENFKARDPVDLTADPGAGRDGISYVLFSFAKVNGLGDEYYDLDSYDASLQGAVLDLQQSQANGTEGVISVSTMAMIEHTRICQLGGGRFQVKA